MTIIKLGIPQVLPDNDVQYMAYISRVIARTDDHAEVTIVKGLRTYAYNIIPSDPGLKERLITELRIANEALQVPVEFSRTMNLSQAIHFVLL